VTLSFSHRTLGQRVTFARGTAGQLIIDEIDRLGAARVMLVAGSFQDELVSEVTDRHPSAVRISRARQHVPIGDAEHARELAASASVDLIVAIGGGSAIGLAKAVALTTGIPIVAVPTTFAGSEATEVWGVTSAGRKETGESQRVLPVTVLYDPTLTLTLPPELVATSAFNALAHGVDSLWAPRTDPINQAFADEGLRSSVEGLRGAHADPVALGPRARLQYGAYAAAIAFASAGSGLHHKICHVLGGRYDLPHAGLHSVMLSYVTAFNGSSAPGAVARVAAALGSPVAYEALEELRDLVGAPKSLEELGLFEQDLPEAARLCLDAVPRSNPRPMSPSDMDRILRSAYHGDDAGGLVRNTR
jgi:alcohol dehydrogenase class IV